MTVSTPVRSRNRLKRKPLPASQLRWRSLRPSVRRCSFGHGDPAEVAGRPASSSATRSHRSRPR